MNTKPYPAPANEAERNQAVLSYRILDTQPELAFDQLGEIAAQICGCAVSYVSFIHEDRFWFKTKYGLPTEFTGCPREIAFCSVTVCGSDLVLVEDLTQDAYYKDFYYVLHEPFMRFYCAMPLITPEGYALGTICVMDFEPRVLTIGQQETLKRLAQQVVSLLEHRRRMIELDEIVRELDLARQELAAEKAQGDALLNRILPLPIADELRSNGTVMPRFHPSATILFADIQGFTAMAERLEPRMLVGMLERYFAAFDIEAERHGLEKIKTIGDAYLAVAGVPRAAHHHAVQACLAALCMQAAVTRLRAERERLRLPFFALRIGLHTGAVIAGTIGEKRFTYDIWGDAVNTAARVESSGEAGRINISEQVYFHVQRYFVCTSRGALEVKNKSQSVGMYFLERIQPEYSEDAQGYRPNARMLALLAGTSLG